MTTRKTLKKLIKNYSSICTNLGFKLNPNFQKDFLHIKRMKTNSTKISFIKKDKIEGLEKNVPDFKLKPNDTEQREKYFTAVKPSKFLSSMILQDDEKTSLFCNISEQFNKDFINNIRYIFYFICCWFSPFILSCVCDIIFWFNYYLF